MKSQMAAADFLGSEFAKRKHKNKSYSLRAYARDLKISPSRLSEVLKGNHGLSEDSADKIAKSLSLNAAQTKRWKDSILAEHSRSAKVRELAKKRLDEFRREDSIRQIKEEQFRVISDWYHGAILELTEVDGFQPQSEWIAQKLGIAVSQVEEAIQRLKQLGLLIKTKDSYRAQPEAYSAFTDLPSAAIRKFHRQVFGMHHESLLQDGMSERQVLSVFMALPQEALLEFGQEMKKFMAQFWDKYQGVKKAELYSISVQMCPVKNRKRGNI